MPRAALEPGGAESLRHPQMTYVDRDSDPAFSRPRTGLEGPGVPGRARGTRHSWKMRQHCCLPLLVGVLFLGFYLVSLLLLVSPFLPAGPQGVLSEQDGSVSAHRAECLLHVRESCPWGLEASRGNLPCRHRCASRSRSRKSRVVGILFAVCL